MDKNNKIPILKIIFINAFHSVALKPKKQSFVKNICFKTNTHHELKMRE